MNKKFTALIAAFVSIVSFSSCTGETGIDLPLLDFSKPQVEVINDINGDSNLSDTIKYAFEVNDKADAYYSNTSRNVYKMENSQINLFHTLDKNGNGATLTDTDGNVYVADSFDTFYTDATGKTYYSSASRSEGRVNTIRLGEYYYECHVRDFAYDKDETIKVDKTYHLYGDRLYSQISLFSSVARKDITAFGSRIEIPAETVSSIQIKDKNGIHTDCNFDATSAEYIAFDIKDVGIVGFIIPSDGSAEKVTVENTDGNYIVTQYASFSADGGLNSVEGDGGNEYNYITSGFRIWTDNTHSFDSIDNAAFLERNPVNNITVTGGNAEGAYLEYDSLSGAYLFSIKGTDFNNAYQNPDVQYSMSVKFANDSYDRDIYVRAKGDNGCLEAAAILDDSGTLVPVNVQICKNFCGDGGEPFYSVADTQYGDSIFPLSLKADDELEFTLLNIYQNWGKYPLKQLSSIEFHVSYYHLSTGVTESNCIAPYFVFGKDGWTLPDFRTASGKMWDTQPQFNSEGILKFMTYRDGKNDVYSEYVHSEIDSVGHTYSDITNTFIADSGAYKYSLRHVEFPQTDENRTYYTLEVEFLEDATYNNFKEDFELFYFDGRMVQFDNASYVADNGEIKYVEVNKDKKPEYYVLGENNPYWGFYNVSDSTSDQLASGFGTNFAMIVRDRSIIIGGEEADIPFVFRDSSAEDFTTGALTLDAEKITFKKGDTICIDMVLLPWGDGTEETDANVHNVREDSAEKSVTITAIAGSVAEDSILPVINCENNTAEFTLKGGRNNIAVRMNGFTNLECPKIQKKTENGWETVELASVNGYDGYSVYYNADGTYGFSFVYTAENPDAEYTFRAFQ